MSSGSRAIRHRGSLLGGFDNDGASATKYFFENNEDEVFIEYEGTVATAGPIMLLSREVEIQLALMGIRGCSYRALIGWMGWNLYPSVSRLLIGPYADEASQCLGGNYPPVEFHASTHHVGTQISFDLNFILCTQLPCFAWAPPSLTTNT